jgi:DAACS family dicarboxylate/amino acid:cation (Na+ or H+) symporter
MKLWGKILIGLTLGVIVGSIIGEKAVIFKPLGDAFLKLINMIIVLLVLSSMTVGITSIHDPKKLGRVGLKTLAIYLMTTLIAIVIGLAFAQIFKPGVGLTGIFQQAGAAGAITPQDIKIGQSTDFGSMFLAIIPENPIGALARGDVLQIIVFSLFLGISINFAGERARPLLDLLDSLSEVMFRLTSIVMEFSPIGVFAIMAWVAGTYGVEALVTLAWFLLAYYLGAFLHILLVFCGILWFMARVHPLPFFKGMTDAIMVAFSTASSSAALPVTLHCVQENLGVSKNIAGFVLPLGSTVNMNGSAMFQGMSVLFIAQAYGIDLTWMQLLTIVVTATLSAVGAAGIPGTGFLMLGVVVQSVGLPIEGLLILAGIDRIREMMSATLNVLGDAVSAVYVAKLEGEFNERRYYHSELVEIEG